MAAWIAMGGYAAYVWSAYGVAALILGGLTWTTLRRYRAARRALDAVRTEAPR